MNMLSTNKFIIIISGGSNKQHRSHTANSTYLLLVSGIKIGNIPTAASADERSVVPSSSELSVQLLIDFVAGRLPCQSSVDLDIASKIVR